MSTGRVEGWGAFITAADDDHTMVTIEDGPRAERDQMVEARDETTVLEFARESLFRDDTCYNH